MDKNETVKQMTLAVVVGWPADYMHLMVQRAREAQRRLLGMRVDGNVKYVNFRRAG